MAKVLNPLLSLDAIGSVAGMTFTSWKGIKVLKAKPTPVRRLRYAQSNVRAILGFLSREWGEITAGERTLWEQYATVHPQPDGFGGTFIMSGLQTFIKLNHTAIRLGGAGALQDAPPADPPLASLLTWSVVSGAASNGDIDVSWAVEGNSSADDFIELRTAGPYGSVARKEVENQYKFKVTTAGNVLLTTVSGLVEDFWYWIRGRYVDKYGQTTAWFTGQATPKTGV